MKFQAEILHQDNNTKVIMSGILDERSELPEFDGVIKGHLILDLEGVTLINSLGCRAWIQWIQGLRAGQKVILTKCSPAIVKQINILSTFVTDATIVGSIYVPYYCEDCGNEEKKLLELADLTPAFELSDVIEHYACGTCGKSMHLDMVKSQYFSFLVKQSQKFKTGK